MYTLEELRERHSVRNYRPVPIPREKAEKLKAEIQMVNTHEAGLHFRLVIDDDAPFKAFDKSYGMFRNARHYIAAIVDKGVPDVVERAGFFAQQIVMKAVTLGLGTCYVGGTYSGGNVNVPLRAGQEVLFLILTGVPDTIDKPRPMARLAMAFAHRKDGGPESFYIERQGETLEKAIKDFPVLKAGLEALVCAPSSLNKRPVRVWIGTNEDSPVIRIGIPDIHDRQYIDLGIAKFNFTEATGGFFDWGNGAYLITD